MDVRFSTDPTGFRGMTTETLRKSFLIDTLFVADTTPMVYSDIDRSITGSAVPVKGPLKLVGTKKEMATEFFADRREIGVINVGSRGTITIDGTVYPMEFKDALYIGRGVKEITFASASPADPAMFYFVSYPAHKEFPTTHAKFSDAEPARLGSQKDANKRTIYKYIHPNGIKSCQLVMGLTELEEGSVWNTMPPHVHDRRMEAYFYFEVPEGQSVCHFMGQLDETRHIWMKNDQAVISPAWSIHSAAGTNNYIFIWGMAGENLDYGDMDTCAVDDLR